MMRHLPVVLQGLYLLGVYDGLGLRSDQSPLCLLLNPAVWGLEGQVNRGSLNIQEGGERVI